MRHPVECNNYKNGAPNRLLYYVIIVTITNIKHFFSVCNQTYSFIINKTNCRNYMVDALSIPDCTWFCFAFLGRFIELWHSSFI